MKTINSRAFLCVLSVMLLLPGLSVAQDCVDFSSDFVRYTGRLDLEYPIFDTVTVGDYTVLACGGGGLVVVDVSDSGSMQVVTTLELRGYVEGLVCDGNIVVARLVNGMAVVDFSDPLHPVCTGNVIGTFRRDTLDIDGDLVAIGTMYPSIILYDISDPENIVAHSHISLSGYLESLSCDDGILVVSNSFDGFSVYNIEDPTLPVLVSEYSFERSDSIAEGDSYPDALPQFFDVVYKDEIAVFFQKSRYRLYYSPTAYLVIERPYLWSFDLSDPGNPVSIEKSGCFADIEDAESPSISWVDNQIVLTLDRSEIYLYEISEQGQFDFGLWLRDDEGAVSATRQGDIVTLAVNNTLKSIYCPNFEYQTFSGSYEQWNDYDTCISSLQSGDIIYRHRVASSLEGNWYFYHVNYVTSFACTGNELEQLDVEGGLYLRGNTMTKIDDHIVLFDNSDAYVIDATDPSNLGEHVRVDLPVSLWPSLVNYNSLVFSALGDRGFAIVDFSDIFNPTTVLHDVHRYSTDVKVNSELVALFGRYRVELFSYTPEGDFTFLEYLHDQEKMLFMNENTLYTSNSRTLNWFDVSDISNIHQLGSVELLEEPLDLVENNGFLYIATGYGGLQVVDPSSAQLVGGVATDFCRDVTVAFNKLFISEGADLIVLPIDCDDPLPVFLQNFKCNQKDGLVHINWSLSRGSDDSELRLLAISETGTREIPFQAQNANSYSATDDLSTLSTGTSVRYILQTQADPNQWFELASDALIISIPKVETAIKGIYPNPFNPVTNIVFTLDRSRQVELAVYSLDGRLVKQLANATYAQGENNVTWLGVDDSGREVPSGVYFVRMVSEDWADNRKVVLAR